MGSLFSAQRSVEAEMPNEITGLTPREVRLVKESWMLVRQDLPGNGVALFLLFFKNYPQHQQYFAEFKDLPYNELKNNRKLRAHATTVMYSLTAVVDSLDEPELLVPILQKVGVSHSKRNITLQAFDDLKATLPELLTERLGSKLTKDAAEAWGKTIEVAFKVITEKL